MNFLKKQWLFLSPFILVGASFLAPSVQSYAAAHPAYGGVLLAIWAKLLHRSDPPQGS